MAKLSDFWRDQQQEFSFSEREEFERGFGTVFCDKIIPILRQMELEREADKKRAFLYMALAITLGATLAILVVMKEFDPDLLSVIGLGVIAAPIKIFFTYHAKHQQESSSKIAPVLYSFLGYSALKVDGVDMEQAANLGVVRPFDNIKTKNSAKAAHKNFGWAVIETQLQKTHLRFRASVTTTVFTGLAFQITTKTNSPRIHFAHKQARNSWDPKLYSVTRLKMKRMDFGRPEFSEQYDIYTDQPDTARAFIDDKLTEGLLWLAQDEASKNHNIECAMEGNRLFLSIWKDSDFLGLGSPFGSPRNVERDLHTALSDFTLPNRVIDEFFSD